MRNFLPDFYFIFLFVCLFCVRGPCLWYFLASVQFLSSLFTAIIITFPPKLVLCSKSHQFYLCSPKSQSHCFNVLYDLYSEQHPLSLNPPLERWETCHVDGKKKKLLGKKTMEESQRRDPSSRMDRHAIDVTWTEKSNKSRFTSYIDRISDTNCNIGKVCGSRRQLGRPWFRQVVPEPHDLLSTVVTLKRAGHAK